MQVALNIRSLEVAYSKDVVLRVPELSIQGKVIAVIGHNGSGKSTLLKTILGLLVPKKGLLHVEAKPAGHGVVLDPRQHMAFSPEGGAVFSDITVEGYLKLWCRLKHGRAKYYQQEGRRFVELFELAPLLPKLGRQLSKGERRRVQAAVGYLINPRLFLFDEPFDGLDIVQTARFTEILGGELDNTAVVFSSHRMEVVERLAECLIVLEGGTVAAAGSIHDVCRKLARLGPGDSVPSLSDVMHNYFLSMRRTPGEQAEVMSKV